MIYSFLLHCKLISEIMYLKKNLFACGQRLTDLLIMYSSWLHAGCQLVNTAAVCFVHTCRFKCFFLFSFFFLKKKGFWEHYGFLFPATTHSHDVKTTETSNFHNVTFDAGAAVDEAGTKQACIIYYLSEQKVNLIVSYKYMNSH